ncbi:hypothetical protein [Pedobacter sp. NJ-S-72]
MKSTPVIEACHELIRKHIPYIKEDRLFADDINQLHHLITNGSLLQTANETAISNHINLFNDDDFRIY